VIKIQIDDAILSLDVDLPDVRAAPIWSGDSTELAKWLPRQYGLFGHRVGNFPRAMDVIHALIVSGKEYQIIEGQDVDNYPTPELPPGAIS
jgi:hypothetical protein